MEKGGPLVYVPYSVAQSWVFETQRAGRGRRHAGPSAAPVSKPDSKHECAICMEPLGSNGGIQALGCMDAFCRGCIATHIKRQGQLAQQPCCPLCKYPIPDAEVRACGPGADLADSDESDDESEGEEDVEESEGVEYLSRYSSSYHSFIDILFG